MSDSLPKLRTPTRHGVRAAPEVKAVMAARAGLIDTSVTRGPSNVVFWPSKSVTPNLIRTSMVDELARAPQAHIKLQQLVNSGLKSIRIEFPSSHCPDIQWTQPSVQKDLLLDLEERPSSPSALDVYTPDDHTNAAVYHPAKIREVILRRRNELGITVTDAYSMDEDIAVARFDIMLNALRSFATLFKGHRTFLERVAEEALNFAKCMHDIMRKRVAKSIDREAEFEVFMEAARSTEAQMQSQIRTLQATVAGLVEQVNKKAEVDQSGERRANVLEALLAEKVADLGDREQVIAIQTRKLFEAEKRIEQLEADMSIAASNTISLQKQLTSRQQVVEKLNFSNEQLYQDRASLQRQLVQIAKRAGDAAGPSGRRQSRRISMTSATAQFAGLESFFTVQNRYMEELMLVTTKSISEAVHRGHLTPRPALQQVSVDGNGSVLGTAARFSDMQHRVLRLTGELSEVRAELDEAIQLHDSIIHDRTARFTVPGVVQALGTAYLPDLGERSIIGPKWFLTLGDSPTVPEHLRAQPGKVRNMRLNRQRVLNHASNFLRWLMGKFSRSEFVNVGASDAWYSSRFAEWIFETFTPEEAVTISYSLHDGLRCFAYEGQCGFVYELLHGLVSFDVWLAIEEWIERVRDLLLRSAREADARLTKKQALAVLERIFFAFPNDEIAKIMAALSRDHSGDGINVPSLFAVDAKGNERQLPVMIREVLLRDRLKLVKEVVTAVLDDSSTSGGNATPHAIASAVLRVDPKRPEHQIDALLIHTFGPAIQQTLHVVDRMTPLGERFVFCGEVVTLGTALARLRHVLFGRWSKRSDGDVETAMQDSSRVTNAVLL